MFGALLKNVAGPDVLMLGSLAMMLAADAVPIPEGLKGFSNKGLLTVACLFVVAAGISNTGALDYYMGKLLGHPKNAASAQIRLIDRPPRAGCTLGVYRISYILPIRVRLCWGVSSRGRLPVLEHLLRRASVRQSRFERSLLCISCVRFAAPWFATGASIYT